MPVAVVQIVDDADVVRLVLLAQDLADGDQVIRLAAPAAVVVQAELALHFRRPLHQRQQLLDGQRRRVPPGSERPVTGRLPDLRVQVVLGEQLERLLVRAPEGEVLDAVLAVLDDLLLEAGDVLVAPVVGHLREAESLHHRGSFGRAAVLAVERHDAPGDQVGAGEHLRFLSDDPRSVDRPHARRDKKGQHYSVHGRLSCLFPHATVALTAFDSIHPLKVSARHLQSTASGEESSRPEPRRIMAQSKARSNGKQPDNTGLEVVGGVAAGAAAGSLLGPLGAAVGAVVGGAVGPNVAEADYSKPVARVKAAVAPVKAVKNRIKAAMKTDSRKTPRLAAAKSTSAKANRRALRRRVQKRRARQRSRSNRGRRGDSRSTREIRSAFFTFDSGRQLRLNPGPK